MDFDLERFLHLYAMNRGILLTPFTDKGGGVVWGRSGCPLRQAQGKLSLWPE